MTRIPRAGFFEKIYLALGKRTRYRIEGDSMIPVLQNGEEVLVIAGVRVEVGDVVIARHPFKSGIIIAKRVTGIDANGKYFLTGDNPGSSTDSRTFGPVSIDYIEGKVTSRIVVEDG